MIFKAKKILAVLVALMLFTSLLSGCSGKNTGSENEVSSAPPATSSKTESTASQLEAKALVRVGVLKGPTSMGMVGMMDANDKKKSQNIYEFTIAGAPDEISGKIISGELDIAAIPTNVASVLYNKTDKKISMVAVTDLKVLYVMTKDEEISFIQDLKGKTIYATGQGATPEYVLNYVLSKNGIDPAKDVTITYLAEHAELATQMLADNAPIALLPEPFVTTVTSKDSEIKAALDITEEWEKVAGGAELAMSCIIVRNDLLEKNFAAVDKFLAEYKASIEFAATEVDAAAELIGKYDILAADVAKKALPACHIGYVDGEAMKASVNGFLTVLMEANPKAVGGSMPDDTFYYQK